MKTVVLENVRSAHNVGSIFRTADAAGVGKIYLVGYTPSPVDRFGRVQPEIRKTSLGASDVIPWEHREDVVSLLEDLREQGLEVVAVEQTPTAKPLPQFAVPQNVAYVFGNEIEGVSDEALGCCNAVVEIPMLGSKESLNVSVATGVVLYHGFDT